MSWRTVVISKNAKLDYQLGYLVVRNQDVVKIHINEIAVLIIETSIVELCDTYDAKCPHEFKLVYNVNSKSFDSNYNYENATDVYDKDVIELVEEWFNECEKNISH